jgi:hypothetical protein
VKTAIEDYVHHLEEELVKGTRGKQITFLLESVVFFLSCFFFGIIFVEQVAFFFKFLELVVLFLGRVVFFGQVDFLEIQV